MIYIDNNTTGFTIPRITNGIGDKVILINQITKRRFELSTDVLNDVGYKVDITDLKLEIGQYDYVVKKNNIPLESGILQVGVYKSQNNQYEVDFNIIQYEPNIVYTPLPEKVLNVTENGVYNVESFDKVDVDVIDNDSKEIIEGLENQISTLEDEISTLEGTVSGLETEVDRLDDLKDSLQSQIDSVTTLSVTENGTYIPEEGTLGWDNVEVNVEGGSGKWKVPNGVLFYNSGWTEIPEELDFSEKTVYSIGGYGCFQNNSSLKSINQPLKGGMWLNTFSGCNVLTTISSIELTTGYSMSTMLGGIFNGCKVLTNINFVGNINCNITFPFNTIPLLGGSPPTDATLRSILTACANTTNTNAKTLTLGVVNKTDSTGEWAELVAACNSKGWTINGLTLQ